MKLALNKNFTNIFNDLNLDKISLVSCSLLVVLKANCFATSKKFALLSSVFITVHNISSILI